MRSNLSMVVELVRMGVRNVARNRRRALLTGAMIALAVTGVVFFKSYTLGIRRVMLNIPIEGMVGAVQVQRAGYAASQDLATLDLDLAEADGIAEKVRKVPNVKAVAPRLLFSGMINNSESSTLFVGLGIDPQQEKDVCPSAPGGLRPEGSGSAGFNMLTSGAPLTDTNEEALVLTEDLAASLKVKVGDTLVMLVRTQAGSMDSVDLVVKGIARYDAGMSNAKFGVVPLKTAQRLLHMKGRVTAYAVSLLDPSQLASTQLAMNGALAGLNPAVATFTWEVLAPYYRDVVNLQDGMFNVVLVVVVLIVLAGIINTMMMSAFERKREIGTLMSMGFRRWAIVVLFVVESIWLAVIAGLVGAVAGVLLVSLTHQTGIGFSIPGGGTVLTRPELKLDQVGFTIVAAVISALVAGLFPAYRASRLQPIEALRSD